MITLFVPTVTALADDVAQAIDEVAAAEAAGKPVLAVRDDGGGRATGPPSVARATSPRSPIRSLRPVRWAELPNGRTGFANRTERSPRSTASTCRQRTRIVEGALGRGDDVWLEPAETRELLQAFGIPLVDERLALDAASAVVAAGSSAIRSS